MILFIVLVAVNVGAWCWLATFAATQRDIEGHNFDTPRRVSTRH